MREIKFRGLNFYHEKGEKRKFEYGYLDKQTITISALEHEKRFTIGSVIVVEETIGQYTGLKDKNGKEIYEGDILEGISGNGVVQEGIYEMFDDKTGFPAWVCYSENRSFTLVCGKDKIIRDEVLGNIHENPELLK